ncbi:MAG TPA: helix-turn-helix domain-containing protein [Dehalococcoidia bacterium]|jgi:excisionase family DNA binding protein
MSEPVILTFNEQLQDDINAYKRVLHTEASLDLVFLCYLRRLARFGYFTLGPITIDVRQIEEIVERTTVDAEPGYIPDDYMRFTSVLMAEVRRSGRKRIDELHYLFAFMRCGEGLPARVFGELGVTPEQVEDYLRHGGTVREAAERSSAEERLLSPEQVAEYLQVHVHTVRAWIRAGRLPARRVAGLRALRVRFSDVEALLRPLEEQDAAGQETNDRA